MVKNLPANAGDKREVSSVPGWGKSPGGGEEMATTPVFLPGKFHGQRSLVGYSPWACKESDMTGARAHTHTHTHTHTKKAGTWTETERCLKIFYQNVSDLSA